MTLDYDVVVIGAGFAGMYAVQRFRSLGFRVHGYERGTDVGGTWYWNRYPGARCDVESAFYSYSFDADLEQEWAWSERFAGQPEILAYAAHVADRFDLRREFDFGTDVRGAAFDDESHCWTVELGDGREVRAQWLVTAVGCLSSSRIPDFEGLDTFRGAAYHTGRWPHEGVDFTGRRVVVVGTGSSGVQAIPLIAQQADQLTVLQRTPAFSLPARNRPLSAAEWERIKVDYRGLREAMRVAPGGVPIVLPIGSAREVPAAQGDAELMRRWQAGGTAFMSTFSDTTRDEDANVVSADFVRARIRELVRDPVTANLLTPYDYPIGAKRICLDTDYYDTFNRDNVTLVDVRTTPIDRIVPEGVVVGGVTHHADALVFATGYDAMTGPIDALDIRGPGGVRLRDAWSGGPRTYLGLASAGFPNLFLLTAPGSPSVLVNMMVSIEQHVEWVGDLLGAARARGIVRVEATADAQDRWVEHVNGLAAQTLYPRAASWYVGANVPGKPRVFMPYAGGMGAYRTSCDAVAHQGYDGFVLTSGDPIPPREGRAS